MSLEVTLTIVGFRLINADRVLPHHLQGSVVCPEIDSETARSRRLSANRAITAHVGLGRVSVDAIGDSTAMARSFKTHEYFPLWT